MKVLDSGHKFALRVLDSGLPTDTNPYNQLTFVKRDGNMYPGNVGRYSGTTLQEVIRACNSRVRYLDNQIPSIWNKFVKFGFYLSVWTLEIRAAFRHGRKLMLWKKAMYGEQCLSCLHVGCKGECVK